MEHLRTIFQTAHRELKPRTPLPEIQVEFFPYAGLNHTVHLRENRLSVRLSDIFGGAPPEIYRSLALILLAKLYRKRIDAAHHRNYRTFILRDEIQERARTARRERGRKRSTPGPVGRHVDLNAVFERMNAQYFGNAMAKPRLTWSAKRSRYILGRYEVFSNTIVISRLMDSPAVPMMVTEYVMFHEMLHMKHHSHVSDSKLIVHTPEFRTEEKRFAEYRQVRLWLKSKLG